MKRGTKTFIIRKILNKLLFLISVLVTVLVILTVKDPSTKNRDVCPQNATLAKTRRENAAIVRQYPVGDSGPYLKQLGLTELEGILNNVNTENPVIVTSVSSVYYSRVLRMLSLLEKTIKSRQRILVYDIGLKEEQPQEICRNGRCELIEFPFHKFPAFVKDCLQCIAWKPLIIQMALEEFGFVIWMDAAVYVPSGDLSVGIEAARNQGIALGHDYEVKAEVKLTSVTEADTFRALGEHACAFENSEIISASLIFVQKNSFIYQYIMRPWVSCALTKSCIAAGSALERKCFYAQNYMKCHRFAQSVFGIIINRLYFSELDKIDLGKKLSWTKCYLKEEFIVIDDIVYVSYEKQSHIYCPHEDVLDHENGLR